MKYIIIFFITISIAGCRSTGTRNLSGKNTEYFPPPDSSGGWRTLTDPADIRELTGLEKTKLDSAFDFIRGTTKNGGLLVVRHGYLVYEKYFGKGQRDASPNLGSCGKSFTSIAFGMMMHEHPEKFPDGLDQRIFTPDYLPEKVFPLSDPEMASIKLGQLLSFSAGIRGMSPGYTNGQPVKIDPVGPDGWYAMTDDYALGLKDGMMDGAPFTTKTLWCEPGGGYSYATASIHIASIILRRITGMELEQYLRKNLAGPLGWGTWGFGYKYRPEVNHTPGGGGICLRSTDMLRFCYMLLHKGKWGDKQIVPEDYVSDATTASAYNPHFQYSLQFNVNTRGDNEGIPTDAFWKIGSGGHCFYVVPSLDLIVWKMGGRDGQYTKGDTGIPEPAPLTNVIPAKEPAQVSDGYEYTKTLNLVLDALTDR